MLRQPAADELDEALAAGDVVRQPLQPEAARDEVEQRWAIVAGDLHEALGPIDIAHGLAAQKVGQLVLGQQRRRGQRQALDLVVV